MWIESSMLIKYEIIFVAQQIPRCWLGNLGSGI